MHKPKDIIVDMMKRRGYKECIVFKREYLTTRKMAFKHHTKGWFIIKIDEKEVEGVSSVDDIFVIYRSQINEQLHNMKEYTEKTFDFIKKHKSEIVSPF